MHSKYSLDGEKSVAQLCEIAKNNGVETIAIADHNTTRAYRDVNGNETVNIIPAIELDCSFQDKDFHLLGYNIDPNHPIWEEIYENVEEMERTAGVKRLAFIKDVMNIYIDQEKLDELCPNGVYEAESVCEVALMDERNKDNKYLKEYFPNGSHSVSPLVDFFWEYCAKGKIAYSEINFMQLEDAIALYRKQNATIVLAHPGNNTKEEEALLEDIIALGIDGLEVYSSYHTPQQISFYKELAKKHDLIITCGSDYHGKSKPHVVMGQCHMPESDEEKLQQMFKQKK